VPALFLHACKRHGKSRSEKYIPADPTLIELKRGARLLGAHPWRSARCSRRWTRSPASPAF